MSKIIIGVMGAGEQATQTECDRAYQLGQRIAQAGWVVLTGGRNVGVMDAASRGAKNAGGLTIGILPNAQTPHSSAVDIPIITDMGNARNNINVLSSRVVIACGMGAGTVSEIALALKANKQIILLTDDTLSQKFFNRLAGERIFIAKNVEDAIALTNVIVTKNAF
ncbi:TIGR00725 family protein [Phormidesmis priestleyi]